MEKKTNKAKLGILNFRENRLHHKAIAFDKISRNCAFYGNSITIHLLGYFCMQNSYLRWKQCKMLRFSWKRKNNSKSLIFVNCLRFSLKLLRRLSQKVKKYYFQMVKKTYNAKLEILNFWENRLNRKAIAFDKISRNWAFYGNSINIHLLGYFCMQNSYLQWKQCKILRFSWKRKRNRKSLIFVNCLRFSLKLWSRLSQKVKKYYFYMEKKTNKAKLGILNFWENRMNRKAIAFDKINQNCALYGNSINIHLLGYFCMQNSYLRWKQCKILRLSWKRKNNRK